MTWLEVTAVAAGVLAWALAGPVALVLVTTVLPGMAADRARAWWRRPVKIPPPKEDT